jgi:hypothetical protein
VTTIVNIYTVHDGNLSVAAKVTIAVITACSVTIEAMHAIYYYLLERLKTDKDRQTQTKAAEDRRRQTKTDEDSQVDRCENTSLT